MLATKIKMRLNIKIITWFVITILFVLLIIQMVNLPAAYSFRFILIFSLAFSLISLLVGGSILAGISNLLINNKSFYFFFRIWSILILAGLNIYFYSPSLKIVIPNNFSGEIHLVIHQDKKNLNINEKGIGYINESNLLKSRGDKKPKVFYRNGKKVPPDRIIGYDSIFFYGRTNINQKNALTFSILPE